MLKHVKSDCNGTSSKSNDAKVSSNDDDFIEMEAIIAEMEQITFNMNKGLQEPNKENLKPVSNTTFETVDNQNVMEYETQMPTRSKIKMGIWKHKMTSQVTQQDGRKFGRTVDENVVTRNEGTSASNLASFVEPTGSSTSPQINATILESLKCDVNRIPPSLKCASE